MKRLFLAILIFALQGFTAACSGQSEGSDASVDDADLAESGELGIADATYQGVQCFMDE